MNCPFLDILTPTKVPTASTGLPIELDLTGAGKSMTFTVYPLYKRTSPRESLPDVPSPHWNVETSYAIAGLTNPEIIRDAITSLINGSLLTIVPYSIYCYPILYLFWFD